MKTHEHLSEAELLQQRYESQVLLNDLRHAGIPLSKENIVTDPEVSELLGVTTRTVRKYRQKGYIGYIKLDGRIIYLKHLLYYDLEKLYYKRREKE